MSLANNAFGPWVYRGFFEAQTSVKPGFLFGEIRNFNVHFVCANESSTGTMPPLALSGDRNRLGPNTVLSLYILPRRALSGITPSPLRRAKGQLIFVPRTYRVCPFGRFSTLILRNRSYLERFSDCEFAQFVSICSSGSKRCCDHGAAFESSY